MKKVLITLLAVLSVFLAPVAKAVELPEKTDHEKVKIYLFWASYCQHCHDFLSYFSENYEEYKDYFEIVTFQVDASDTTEKSNNSKLMSAVGEVIEETSGGIPMIVVGNSFKQVGFGSDGSNIIEEALKAYEDDNYTDIVQKEIEDNKISASGKTFEEALEVAGISYNSNSNKKSNDAIIVGVVFGIVIAGFVGLVIISRKN